MIQVGLGYGEDLMGLPSDGAVLPSALLSVTDELGTYEEVSPSAGNPVTVGIGDYIEYDWHIEHNGASRRVVTVSAWSTATAKKSTATMCRRFALPIHASGGELALV